MLPVLSVLPVLPLLPVLRQHQQYQQHRQHWQHLGGSASAADFGTPKAEVYIATNNFAFEVKAILGLETTHLETPVAKIGLNGPHY